MSSWRARVIGGRFVLLALLVYILLRPVIGLGHELAIWLVAGGLRALADSGVWQPIIGMLGLDPVYLGAAVHAAGGVQVAGLAVAAPFGGALHEIAPWAFLAPERVTPGAAISLVAVSGTPVLGRDLARLGGDIILLAFGIWLVRGWGSHRFGVGLVGWLIQGQVVVNHLLDKHVRLADLDASGLPFALATAQVGGGSWFTDTLQQLPDPVQTALVGGAMVLVAYGCAVPIALMLATRRFAPGGSQSAPRRFARAVGPSRRRAWGWAPWRLLPLRWALLAGRRFTPDASLVGPRRFARADGPSHWKAWGWAPWRLLLLRGALLAGRRFAPGGSQSAPRRFVRADGPSRRRAWGWAPWRLLLLRWALRAGTRLSPQRSQRGALATRRPEAMPRAALGMTLAGASVAIATAISPIGAMAIGVPNFDGTASARASTGRVDRLESVIVAPAPSQVQVQVVRDAGGNWEYLVNGTPEVIRGVGYNPQYAGMPDDQRAQLYERDFSAMHQRGINTIEGWFEPQFDEVTLDAAARNGIGVLMPFELNQDWPYDNPNVQQSILDHVSAYVEKYKDNPAVRMWAPGNEDLHRILYPHMRDQGDNPAVRTQADAFAAFLPRLVDRIHELDPNHPVIYRDAEDLYLPRLKSAFAATGVDRPWLVYGANVYSEPRLQQIVSSWPSQFLDSSLVISEYAPGGDGPTQRPLGYQEDWATIRSRPGIVLGGLAYTWATNGPEQLDRVFGLVDPQGGATDGALAALSAAYLNDLRATGGSTQT